MLSKQLKTMSVALILVLFCATAAIAAPWHFGRSRSRFDSAPVSSVYFFPQDMDTYSNMYRYDSWGLMNYRLWGEEFGVSFKGFNLDRRTNYTLIYYPDPEGGADMISLGSGTTNRRGHLNIRARLDICSLPSTTDPNYFYGAQIMLVPSESIEEGVLLKPGSEYNLISYHAIRFTDTDGCPVVTPPEEPPADETGDEGETSEDGSDGGTEDPSTEPDDYDNDPDIVYPY